MLSAKRQLTPLPRLLPWAGFLLAHLGPALPNGDRQFVILLYIAHSPGYSNNRHLLWYAMRNFLAAPAAVASG